MGAFYAPRAGEGNQILHMKSFKSVDTIRGHTNQFVRSEHCCDIVPSPHEEKISVCVDNQKDPGFEGICTVSASSLRPSMPPAYPGLCEGCVTAVVEVTYTIGRSDRVAYSRAISVASERAETNGESSNPTRAARTVVEDCPVTAIVIYQASIEPMRWATGVAVSQPGASGVRHSG
jgi:hypothetical protein